MKIKRNKAFEQIIKLNKGKKDKEIDWHLTSKDMK